VVLVSKYCEFVKLSNNGRRSLEMVIAAKDYLHNKFPTLADDSDVALQRQLWHFTREQQADDHMAEICLRCYISHQVYQACVDIGAKFGKRHGFGYEDLLPIVLGDEVLQSSQYQQINGSSYQSLATTILKTYNPNKGSLNTWVSRYVKQHPEVRNFLLQHGVYLVSDWALLNDTNVKELQRIFASIYHLAMVEVKQACELLVSYHAVYRADRLKFLAGSTLPCQPPTDEQLSRIAEDLKARMGKRYSNEAILKQLQSIAAKLREYGIAARGGNIKTLSYNQEEVQPIIEHQQAISSHEDQEENEFIRLYQKQLIESLDQAFVQVLEDYIISLQRRRPNQIESFIKGLELFHCRGESMSQIAPQINLEKQYEVTRLLKLNDLRADVRQRLLVILRTKVIDIAKQFTDIQQLQNLDKKVEEALSEQINKIITQAESEARNPVRNQPLKSLFAHRLCLCLDQRHLNRTQ
jgi:hypothetical protein